MKHSLMIWLLLSSSLCMAQSFEVYVSDAGNFSNPPWQILKFDMHGQNPSVFMNTNLNWPQDILFVEDSNFVLVSNLGSGTISKHDATTGAYLSDFAGLISGPTRMKIGPDSLIYVLQWSGNGKVKRYAFDGSFIDDFTSVGVPQSIGIDWDEEGFLYVSSYSGDLVRKFDTTGADMGIFIGSSLIGPTNIWFDLDGDLLVSDYDGTSVKRFDSTGNYVNEFITGLSRSEGIAFLPNGDLLIGNGSTASVKQFDSNGNYLQEFISSGTGNLLNPNAIMVRQTTVNSVLERRSADQNLFTSSSGQLFYLNPEISINIRSIGIYDVIGKLKCLPDQGIWNASPYRTGIYFAKAEMADGTFRIQKLIVSD